MAEPNEPAASDQLLSALKRVYQERGELPAWDEESRIYPQALSRLATELVDTYEIARPLALGSTATVWQLTDKRLNQPRALKLPRPRLSRLSNIVRVIRGERDKLAALNHQNIVKIFTAGELKFTADSDDYSFPYFVMEFLPGVRDLADFVEESVLTCPALELVEYFRNVLAGLAYLHHQGVIHCDIKPGNILIAPGRPALITDFGYAKHFPRPGNPAQLTDVTFTRHYGHPELQRGIKDSTDQNATIAEIPKNKLKKQFDLYALGRTLLEALRTHILKRERANGDRRGDFTPYQRQFVSIVAKRLLDGHVERVTDDELDSDLISGLAKPVMEEVKYHTPEEALSDLEKLLDLYSIEGDVPELNPNIAAYIQIPHCRVPLTPRVQEIIDHPTFTRLAQVTQLGFVSLVYPGATHTRYEHVLGTFAHCCEYVRALWHDQRNALFQCLMTRHDVEVLLLAALLHDIGQYPMAHDLSEVSSDFAHETFGSQLLQVASPVTNDSLADVVFGGWEVQLEELDSVWSANQDSPFKHRLLKAIISGPLDCDKMDYVRRDSTHLGVTFGLALDHERLLRNVTVAYAPRTERSKFLPDKMDIVGLGVAEKALVVGESLVRVRKDLFTQVYWHHTVRSLKAMLGFVVRNTLSWLDNTDQADRKEEFWSAFDAEVLWSSRTQWGPTGAAEHAATAAGRSTAECDWLDADSTDDHRCVSGLNPADDALLLFFRRFARPREQRVIDAMRARRLFKRLYVLTFSKEEEAYNQIYNRFHTYRLEGNLREIERLRKACEDRVRGQLVESLQREHGGALDSEKAEIKHRIEAADPLVLVDVPVKAVSRSIERESIYYLPEDIAGLQSGRDGMRQFFITPVALEQTPFDKAVGKIRLFVPPDLKDVLVHYLPEHHERLTRFLLG